MMINFLNIKKIQNILELEIPFHSANLFGTLALMASVLFQIRLWWAQRLRMYTRVLIHEERIFSSIPKQSFEILLLSVLSKPPNKKTRQGAHC